MIDRSDQLARLVDRLQDCPAIALDAEMDSYYSYYPKLCLIQVSTDDEDYLIDPLSGLDLSPLRSILSSPRHLKVLHAAENDIPYFREHIGGELEGLFDTHIAAKVLGLARSGLAPLLAEYLQVHLDKRFQTADWRLRPLPEDQAEYAKTDTRHLLPLWRLLQPMLEEQDLLDQAHFSFAEACQATASQRVFNPEGWRKIAGANTLPPTQKARLRDLFAWREEVAQRLDSAVFRVLPDGVLLALTHHSQSSADELRQHFRHGAVQSHAQAIVDILRQAPTRPVAAAARPPQEGRLTQGQEKLLSHLRNWRNAYPGAPLTNRHLRKLVVEDPANWTSFTGLNLMAPRLLETLGKELWEEFEQHQAKRQSGRRSPTAS